MIQLWIILLQIQKHQFPKPELGIPIQRGNYWLSKNLQKFCRSSLSMIHFLKSRWDFRLSPKYFLQITVMLSLYNCSHKINSCCFLNHLHSKSPFPLLKQNKTKPKPKNFQFLLVPSQEYRAIEFLILSAFKVTIWFHLSL